MSNPQKIKSLFVCSIILFTTTTFGQYNIYDICRHGSIDDIQVLYEADSSVISKPNKEGFTPLILAAYNGNKEIVTFLIEKNVNVNSLSSNGTALMAAVFKGDVDIAKLLIEAKAKVNEVENTGMSALHYAAFIKNKEMVSLLVNAGADLTIKDIRGQTPYDYVKNTNNNELLKLLKI
ncbi:ankyrin repeat domain-containing protein [Urechidicola sp. KH5]